MAIHTPELLFTNASIGEAAPVNRLQGCPRDLLGSGSTSGGRDARNSPV
jgi:hypothetical protein